VLGAGYWILGARKPGLIRLKIKDKEARSLIDGVSFPRRRACADAVFGESIYIRRKNWIPACAGITYSIVFQINRIYTF
jgi:hypothetical protein